MVRERERAGKKVVRSRLYLMIRYVMVYILCFSRRTEPA
jgi:hypothetical protein